MVRQSANITNYGMDSHTVRSTLQGGSQDSQLKQTAEVLEKAPDKGVQLKRELGLFSAANLIIGVMIGKFVTENCENM